MIVIIPLIIAACVIAWVLRPTNAAFSYNKVAILATAIPPLVAAVAAVIFQLLHNAAGITYPAAYLSYRHILRLLAARDEGELKDLGLAAERKSPVEQFIEKRDAARRSAGSADSARSG